MNLISQMVRSSFLLTALLLTLIGLSADQLVERGTVTDWINDCASLLEAQRKGEQLARETQSSANRLLVKGKIAEALNNGEMKLIDAAAIFRWLHEDPKSWHNPDRPMPGFKDGEAWCREVIRWTERYISFDRSSNLSHEVGLRLEAELQGQRKRHSAVTLPD